jgi:type II secretory pathway pseudopilin PulG
MNFDAKHWVLLMVGAVLAVVAVVVGASYLGAREDKIKLQATMDAQKLIQAHLDADQKQRDADLKAKIDDLEASKQAVAKMPPAQQVQEITKVIPLPFPMNVQQQADPITGKLEEPKVEMPVANLKPLYDYGVTCTECQDRVSKLTADLAGAAQREQSITKERDAAIKAAKGGSFWARTKRTLKTAVCAGAGAGLGSVGAGGKGAVVGAIAGVVACSIH